MTATSDLELVLSRLVDAPRALVFEAMTNPTHVIQWWGPFGFKNTLHEMKVEAGGRWRMTMHGPDGTDYPSLVEFKEVVPNERLVYRHSSGKPGGPAFDVVITLADEKGRTRLTLTQTYPTVEAATVARSFGIEGGNQTFTRLDAYAAAMREQLPAAVLEGADPSPDADFVLTRVFDAPRALVYRVMTEPEHLGKWFGPAGMGLRVVAADLRPGGAFRYAMQAGQSEMFGKFVFRELRPVERFAYVVSFTDADGTPTRHPMSATWPLEVLAVQSLAEHGGKTVLMARSLPLHAAAGERDTFRAGHPGMQQGNKGMYDNLDAYLKTLAGS